MNKKCLEINFSRLKNNFIRINFLLFMFFVADIYSGGLSTTCGMMTLGNLKIGQEYSLKQLLGYPYNVTYKGSYPVDLKIEVVKPDTTTADGFEPIPDISWLRLQREEFALDPGETANTDIIISIPNDENLLGKKFRVIISPYTSAPKGDTRAGLVFALGLSCNLYLSIAPKPPTEEEIRQQKKRLLSNYMNYSVSPERIFLYDLLPNKVYNLTKEFGEVIKIINATTQDVMVSIEQIKGSQIGIFLPDENTFEIEDMTLLKAIPKKFNLKKDSIKSLNLTLSTKGLVPKKVNQDNENSQQVENETTHTKYFTVLKVNFENKYTSLNNYVKFYIEIR